MRNKKVEIIWRYGVVSFLITIFAMLIVYRMVHTTIIHAAEWNAKADSTLNRVLFVRPMRGDILACDSTVLATTLTVYDISIDYRTLARNSEKFMNAIDSLTDSLAYYYPVHSKAQWHEHLTSPFIAQIKAKEAGKEKKLPTYHLILKNANYYDYERILKFPFFKNFKKKYSHGLCASPKEIRVLPYGDMASFSVGRCNYSSAPKFEGASKRRDSVDVLHGYSGLEYALDSLLYGKNGTAHYEQLTRSMYGWVDTPAQDGLTLLTTIDINMQDIVENELMDMLQKSQAEWGTCLLMEVKTGDIKAISNLERDKDSGRYIEARNYSVMRFEPGSIMKPISMLCALEDGYAYPLDKEYTIGGAYSYGGGPAIHDTHSPATLPVRRFIEYSSNIGMTKLIAPHYENDLNGFRERLRQIGLLDKFGTYLHGEITPLIPDLDPKKGGKVSLSRMTYGYATMIPPLYTCAFYNAIANDGKFVRPRVVQKFISRDGNVIDNPVSYVRDSICSKRNAEELRKMIYEVVYGQGGTAKTVRNDYVKIAGKTGTCIVANEIDPEQKRDTTSHKAERQENAKGYIKGKYRLAFCGFFPYENPKYTCIVLICSPADKTYNSPGASSGIVLRNIAMKMYARGMLENNSDYRDEQNPGSQPVHYASATGNIEKTMKYTGSTGKHYTMPKQVNEGCTPDVCGLGVREAIARIEEAGYTVKIKGSGYATSQSPAPGTPLPEGKTVEVIFTTNPGRKS